MPEDKQYSVPGADTEMDTFAPVPRTLTKTRCFSCSAESSGASLRLACALRKADLRQAVQHVEA